MIRYQSNQNLKKKIEQNQLLSTGNANLRMNTVLKTGGKTILRTNQTKSRLKRKLLVYKMEDKFYIDNSAAYALKLTNVRAIMTENPHLIEVSRETLYRFQNDEDIEIKYQELNKKIVDKAKKDDLIECLEELEQGEYGIGIHGITQENNEEKQKIASSISSEGLNINNNSKTILSTSISLGTNEDTQQISQEIMRYKFGNRTRANVIIAVPLYIQNENGKKIFLGFPEKNKRTSGQQYEEQCILDRICAELKKIPPEFILGYYCENPDGSESFTKNEQHYSNITPEKRESLFNKLYSNMDDISRNYNELIINGNIEKLSQIKGKMQQLGWNSYMVDNSMTLAQKYKGKLDTRKKNVRRIFLEDNHRTKNSSGSIKNKRTRKILLDACAEIKLSDIITAKATLKEGLEEQVKNYEGKEV